MFWFYGIQLITYACKVWPQKKYNTTQNKRDKTWKEFIRAGDSSTALILISTLAVCGYVSWSKTGKFMAAWLLQEMQTKAEINLEMRWRDADAQREKAYRWDHINHTPWTYDSFLEL